MRKLSTKTAKPATVATVDAVETVSIPAPVAVETVTIAKPDAIAVRAARVHAARRLIEKLYAGASKAIHRDRPSNADVLLSRITSPVQQIADAPSPRDESGLAAILAASAIASANGASLLSTLAAIGLDIGVASRCASARFVIPDGNGDVRLSTATDGPFRFNPGDERATKAARAVSVIDTEALAAAFAA